MNAKRILSLLVISMMVFMGLALMNPGAAQSSSQDDAGTGRDASNSQSNPTTLPGADRYRGELVANTDEHDWYTFSAARTQTTGDRPLTLSLFSDWNADYSLELYRSGSQEDPEAVGTGSHGAKTIHWSLDKSSGWIIHVTGETTGRYSLTLDLDTENDAEKDGDAPGGDITTTTGMSLASQLSGTMIVQGHLQPGDRGGDVYEFTGQDAASNVLIVTVHHPPSASGFRLELDDGSPIAAVKAVLASGAGYTTAYVNAANYAGGSWSVKVSSASASHGGPYTLSIFVGPDADDDPEGQAPSGFTNPAIYDLEPGFYQGTLADTGDQDDAYQLAPGNIAFGDTIHLGIASHRAATNRPFVVLELHQAFGKNVGGAFEVTPGTAEHLASAEACGAAASITWTSQQPATVPAGEQLAYLIRVREIADGPEHSCAGASPLGRAGPYALLFQTTPQADADNGGDAPAAIINPPQVSGDSMQAGWMDTNDRKDAYGIGGLSAFDSIRLYVAADVPNMNFKATVYNDLNAVVGSTVQSADGTMKIHLAAEKTAQHKILIEQSTNVAGPYRFYVEATGGEPPPPVTLDAIEDSDTSRTAVDLSWTRAANNDFKRYEVHASTLSGFSPSGSTFFSSITNRDTTTETVTGLNSGTTYHFKIRNVDKGDQFSDSNQRSAATDSGPVGNRAPTLADGHVSPQEGSPSTSFTFRVTYTDADNDAPTRKLLFISGVQHSMTTTDTTYTDGSVFTFSTTLPAGTHSFRFEFSDGDSTARDPSVVQGTYEGPSVSQGGNNPPTVTASADPNEGEAPLTVQFSAVAEDEGSVSYCWDFDTSNGVQGCDSSLQNPQHEYTEPKNPYFAQVKVTDEQGAASTATVTVRVRPPSNLPPTVDPTADPASGTAPLTVQFAANADDEDGSIAAYEWDFDNADGIQVDSTDENPSHAYQTAGNFAATVLVRDDKGAEAQGSVTVTVSTEGNGPPSVFINASPERGPAPLTVTFTGNTADPDGDDVTVSWDFDRSDGINSDATGEVVEHTYTVAGTFVATATVADPSGAQGTATFQVRVGAVQPGDDGDGMLFIDADPRSGKAPLNVTFTADTSGVPAPVAQYLWDFGDNSTSEDGPETFHEYATEGFYTVTLRVTDDDGNVYESSIDVEVRGKGSPGVGLPLMLVAAALAGLAIHRNARRPGKE